MGFLGDLFGDEDPGKKRQRRIDDETFRRAVFKNASMFSAMSRSGLDIGDRGRAIIAQARRMGLVTPLKSLPRSIQGVPVRGQERTRQILEQLSGLFAGRVRNRQQALGVIPKLPRKTPDLRLGTIEPPSQGLRNPRIGNERSLLQDTDINDLLGFDEDFLIK